MSPRTGARPAPSTGEYLRHLVTKTSHDWHGRRRRQPHPIRLVGLSQTVRGVAIVGVAALVVVSVLVALYVDGPARKLPVVLPQGQNLTYHPMVVIVVLVSGGVGMVALGLHALRSTLWPRLVESVAVLVGAGLALLPATILGRGHGLVVSIVGVLVTLVALVLGAVSRPWGTPVVVAALALPYVAAVGIVVWALWSPRGQAAHVTRLATFEVRVSQQCAIAAATVVLVGVFSALTGKVEHVAPLMARPIPLTALALLVTVKVAYLAARYSGTAGNRFGDAVWWNRGTPASWVHATTVAAVIGAVAVYSARAPLEDGDRQAGFVAIGATVVSWVAWTLALCTLQLFLASYLPDRAPGLDAVLNRIVNYGFTVQLVVFALVAVGAAALLARRKRLSVGVVLVGFAVVWQLPPLVARVAEEHRFRVPAFLSLPEQVDTALTLFVAAALVVSLWRPVPRNVLLRLLVVPFVLTLSISLVPAGWSTVWWRWLLVLGVLIPVLVTGPQTAADPQRQTRVVLWVVSSRLLLIVAYYLTLAVSVLVASQMGVVSTFAWLWVAIPVAGVLCVSVRQAPTGAHVATRPVRRRQPRKMPLP